MSCRSLVSWRGARNKRGWREGRGAATWSSATQSRVGSPRCQHLGASAGPPAIPVRQRVGPRHSCGWEPRMEANGAAAAADATADAARPLHTHPSLRPPARLLPPAQGEPVGAAGAGAGGGVPGGWPGGGGGGGGGGGRDAAAARVRREPARSRQDGRRERYVCPWPGGAGGAGVRCSASPVTCAGAGGVVICVCVPHCVSLRLC